MKSDKVLKTNLNRRVFELLAPAGNKNIAKKAIDSGADAVYIAYSSFGARAKAGNTFEDIIETVNYAHKFGVRVYVTVNTILNDEELQKAVKLLKKLSRINTDAVIIQDFGLLESDLPKIRLHASTQCHNNTLEKIKFLEKTGFKRVILPREITLEEIRKIKANTNIELECFIQGALCVSYSGQCYLSEVIGGRSANRGECAQPCRKKYSLFDETGNCLAKNKYLLSLKDLNLSERIEELILSGITSFKIEGRLKDENYVANATAYYGKILDDILVKYNLKRSSFGKSYYDFTPDINKSFNRGFCEFNIDGKKSKIATVDYTSSKGELIGTVKYVKNNYFVTDNNFSFNNGDGICFYDENKTLKGININKSEGNKNFPADIKNIKQGMQIYRNFDKAFDDKLKTAKIERKIDLKIRIRETEACYLIFSKSENGNEACIALPKIYEEAKNKEKAIDTIKTGLTKTGGTEFSVSDINIKINMIPFFKISEINEIRRNLIEKMRKIIIKNYKMQDKTEKINITEYPVKELDYRANIYNKKAEEFYIKRGCTIKEKALESQKNKRNREVMISKYCIKHQFGLCPKQNPDNKRYKNLIIKDEFDKRFLVEFVCSECVMKVRNID